MTAMKHADEFLQHIEPLEAPLPAPSVVFNRRPRADAEAIDAMAAARMAPLPRRQVLYGATPGRDDVGLRAQVMRSWHLDRAMECERAKAAAEAELTNIRLRDFNLHHPGPITMHEPHQWWCRVNWGAVAMLLSAATVSGLCIWGML